MGIRTKILAYAFNRGLISPLALARFDLKRLALSSSLCTNWMFRTLGSMMLRPGLAYVDGVFGNSTVVHIPFVRKITDTAIIELTNNLMRVRVNEQIISRVSVSTAVTNGSFSGSLSGWTQGDDPGGLSTYVAGDYMGLTGNGTARGLRYQTVMVAGGDLNKEHALRIVVSKGYVVLRVGTSNGDDNYINVTTLAVGIHSLAFTPSGNFTIQFSSATKYMTLIKQCTVEAAGAMTIATTWNSAMLQHLRWDESVDVLFIATDGTLPQMKIERRGIRSWSLVNYFADDGPFLNGNVDQSILLSGSALNGDITVTSNIPFFKAGHVGSLFSLTSQSGQQVDADVAGVGQFSDPVEVTGISANGGRNLIINTSGTWTGTLRLQFSVGAPGSWVDTGVTFTANPVNYVYNDGFDNQVIFYRLGVEVGPWTGSAHITLNFAQSSGIAGIVRIDGYNNSTSVSAHVLKPLGSINATSQWSQGIWSSIRGFPDVPLLYEGRLWWFGQDYIIGSVSDAYASYDQTVTGDSAPIIRTFGQGPVSDIQWALGLQRLLVGCDGSEKSVRSSALDEPLTPTDFNIKTPSTRGSAAVAAVQVDTNGIFVQRGDPDNGNNNLYGTRLIEIAYQGSYAIVDYTTSDLSEFCPEIFEIGISKITVQRKIDTRVHILLRDGTVIVCVYDPIQKERGFLKVVTAGIVTDIFCMPGGVEDKVYYAVQRTINSSTVVYLERWALESECTGQPVAKLSDSHINYVGAETTTITGLTSQIGASVVVWGWNTINPFTVTMPDGSTKTVGRDMGTYTVDGAGTITGLPAAVTNACIGISYTAQWQSVKLTQTVQDGTSLGFAKIIDELHLVLANTHYRGLQFGTDFTHMDNLPTTEEGMAVQADTVWAEYDKSPVKVDATWDPNTRLCLQASSPRPCTILAANIGVSTSER